jgi:hypothetical protein
MVALNIAQIWVEYGRERHLPNNILEVLFSTFNMTHLVVHENAILSKYRILHNMTFGLKCRTIKVFQEYDLISN